MTLHFSSRFSVRDKICLDLLYVSVRRKQVMRSHRQGFLSAFLQPLKLSSPKVKYLWFEVCQKSGFILLFVFWRKKRRNLYFCYLLEAIIKHQWAELVRSQNHREHQDKLQILSLGRSREWLLKLHLHLCAWLKAQSCCFSYRIQFQERREGREILLACVHWPAMVGALVSDWEGKHCSH